MLTSLESKRMAMLWAVVCLMLVIPSGEALGQKSAGGAKDRSATNKDSQSKKEKQRKIETEFKVGDIFYQQLTVSQKPKFKMQGLTLQTPLSYRILSQYQIKKIKNDGSLVVAQKIGNIAIKADATTRGLLAGAVQKLRGKTLTYTLNAKRMVVDLKGFTSKVVVGARKLKIGAGLQMASLLDEDGWKEITQLTFFQPQRKLRAGQKWQRKMAHSWGPLGRWRGQAIYVPIAKKKHLVRIDYLLQMKWLPPVKGKKAALPVQIFRAEFKPQKAGGTIIYDDHAKRVVRAEEHFNVHGLMSVKLLGSALPVELWEEQVFQIQISETNPR